MLFKCRSEDTFFLNTEDNVTLIFGRCDFSSLTCTHAHLTILEKSMYVCNVHFSFIRYEYIVLVSNQEKPVFIDQISQMSTFHCIEIKPKTCMFFCVILFSYVILIPMACSVRL